jgi:hypothetical protein
MRSLKKRGKWRKLLHHRKNLDKVELSQPMLRNNPSNRMMTTPRNHKHEEE